MFIQNGNGRVCGDSFFKRNVVCCQGRRIRSQIMDATWLSSESAPSKIMAMLDLSWEWRTSSQVLFLPA